MALSRTRRKEADEWMNQEESPMAPDSTTLEREREMGDGFAEAEDVLFHDEDGLFYLGTVVLVDLQNEQCLVKFGDNTERWSAFRDLTKLSLSASDLLCVVCKLGHSKSGDDIVQCDRCSRGYHQQCHKPQIPKDFTEPNARWMCHKCKEEALMAAACISLRNSAIRPDTSLVEARPIRQLPYDLSALVWDTNHRSNSQDRYCYCGRRGDWFRGMLQCHHCMQWFHEKCLACLKYPLLYGDRFYVFVCSVCNEGKEFLHRLEPGWEEVIHLVLYHLTVSSARKYHDLESTVLPFLAEGWVNAQMPHIVRESSVDQMVREITAILQSHRNRFKSGREIKKRTSIWGLRVRMPPSAPPVVLPWPGPITTERFLEANPSLQHINVNGNSSQHAIAHQHQHEKFGVSSTQPKLEPKLESSPEPPETPQSPQLTRYSPVKKCTSPVISPSEQETNVIALRKRTAAGRAETESLRLESASNSSSSSSSSGIMTRASSGSAKKSPLVKSSSSTPVSNPTICLVPVTTSQTPQTKQQPTPPKVKQSQSDDPPVSPKLLRSRRSQSQMKAPVPVKVKQDGKWKQIKTQKARKLLRNAIAKQGFQHNTNNRGGSLLATQCDTSGDDTSSHGTLDSIIPPPKDFEGQNNPFRSLDFCNIFPTLRPTKRKLCEKDIRISKNGEVKRRRQRKGGLAENNKTETSKLNSQINNCVHYALNGRLASSPNSKRSSDEGSCSQEISYRDLKSSVNSYFGAANRIASGEKFNVLAKRITPLGKVQYLLEWEGPAT